MNVLDGRKGKAYIYDDLKIKLDKLDTKLGLAVIQIGHDEASDIYIRSKEKMAQELGYCFQHIHFDDDVKEEEVIDASEKLNSDDSVDGILLRLPIPSRLDAKRILNAIDSVKDVDGLTDINAGKLFHGSDCLVSCTAMGVIDLLKMNDILIDGKCVVIVGRSDLVGKPLASLMLNSNATVILCHSKTRDIEEYTRRADILISAIGCPKFVRRDMIKDGAIVIDVGTNKTVDSIVGDVDFDSVKEVASYITPVPGGIGQMTIAELAKNVYKAHVFRKSVSTK